MPNIGAIQNTPDISFIDNKTVEEVRSAMIADYEAFMTAAEGQEIKLERTSVHRMILNAAAAQVFQALQYVDRAGKQNMLKYSYSDFLDNLALFKGVTRLPAASAVTTLRFMLSAVRDVATAIPMGTRASTAEAVYFGTDKYAEIPVGSSYIDVQATCTEVGKAANGIAIGDVRTLVDPIPYVASVSNTVATGGVRPHEVAASHWTGHQSVQTGVAHYVRRSEARGGNRTDIHGCGGNFRSEPVRHSVGQLWRS